MPDFGVPFCLGGGAGPRPPCPRPSSLRVWAAICARGARPCPRQAGPVWSAGPWGLCPLRLLPRGWPAVQPSHPAARREVSRVPCWHCLCACDASACVPPSGRRGQAVDVLRPTASPKGNLRSFVESLTWMCLRHRRAARRHTQQGSLSVSLSRAPPRAPYHWDVVMRR